MEERQPPPSSSSSPAAGLSRKDDVKRKSGSDADADADQAKSPKPLPWRGGVIVFDADDNNRWGEPYRLSWRDDNPPWGKQEVDEPALSGDEWPLGFDYGTGRVMVSSPEERGGGSRKRVRLSDETQDTFPPSTRRHPRHDLEETEHKIRWAPQEPALVVRDAKAVVRDKEVACLKFIFGSRSKREGKVWHCVCKATNSAKRKLVFGLPKFRCACGIKFLQKNNLDFSLADVRVNSDLVVSRIFDQKGPHCIANALCQAILMMHTMDCITEETEVNAAVANICPGDLASAYSVKYKLMESGDENVRPSSVHKFIKMALMLKNHGIELEDQTFWRIGDVSFIDKDNYEEICEELANGVPLLAIITPGVNFEYLKYCEVYRPPLLSDFHECNKLHEPKDKHTAHMVVLIGPSFKASGKNPGRSYYFVNSHEYWCERKVYETYHEESGDIQAPVRYGIGKVEEKGLVYSVIKLWKFGETARPGSVTLEDEDENDEASMYINKVSNRQKFNGQYFRPRRI